MTQTYAAGQTLTAEAVNAELAFPTGAMLPYAGASAPTETIGGVAAWLLCDGSAVSRTTYAALFAALSTTYGAGDGSTTFNLPDLRGRVPIGAGTGAQNGGSGSGAVSGGTALTARTRGAFGGDERLATHNHTATDSGHTHGGNSRDYAFGNSPAGGGDNVAWGASNQTLRNGSWGTNSASANITVANNVGGGTGGNMPPFIVTNYLIKT